jgi:hypothetical protein
MSVFTSTKAKDWEITCRGITGFAFGLGGTFTTYWLRSKTAHVMAQFKLVVIGSGVGGGVNDSTAKPSAFSDTSFDTSPNWERVTCRRAFSVEDLDWKDGYFEQFAVGAANLGVGVVRLGANAPFTAKDPHLYLFQHFGYGWNTGLGVSLFSGTGRWVLDFHQADGNYVCTAPAGSNTRKCALLGDIPPPMPLNTVCAGSPGSKERTCKVVR